MDVQPSLWKRDARKIQQIEQAADWAAVLDLTPVATGLAEYAWLKRMREFGASAAPAIVARLQSDWMRSHRNVSAGIQERFIGALRWCEDTGAEALIDCWNALDNYGRSLACVALGLLDTHSAADRVWTFFESTQSTPTTHWIGPLDSRRDLLESARVQTSPPDVTMTAGTGHRKCEAQLLSVKFSDTRFGTEAKDSSTGQELPVTVKAATDRPTLAIPDCLGR